MERSGKRETLKNGGDKEWEFFLILLSCRPDQKQDSTEYGIDI